MTERSALRGRLTALVPNVGSSQPRIESVPGRQLVGPDDPQGREADRGTEEIDIVGIGRSRATVIGECKWTNQRLSVSILAALHDYKLPALRQDGVRVATDAEIILFSRAGFTDGLIAAAEQDANLRLVDLLDFAAGL